VLPVVRVLASRGLCVSIDTRHAATMARAIEAGARIVNDVTALADPDAIAVVARTGAAAILMHMRGTPATMQDDPRYAWAPGAVYDALGARVEACVAAGIPRERLAIDPGIGFGKTAEHSAAILDHLALFHGLGCAVAVGASRKRLVAAFSRGEDAPARLPGSLAAALHAAGQGAQILRVHDVAAMRQALAVAARIGAA
jgi:dihydropteroate synthase